MVRRGDGGVFLVRRHPISIDFARRNSASSGDEPRPASCVVGPDACILGASGLLEGSAGLVGQRKAANHYSVGAWSDYRQWIVARNSERLVDAVVADQRRSGLRFCGLAIAYGLVALLAPRIGGLDSDVGVGGNSAPITLLAIFLTAFALFATPGVPFRELLAAVGRIPAVGTTEKDVTIPPATESQLIPVRSNLRSGRTPRVRNAKRRASSGRDPNHERGSATTER